MFLEKIKSRFFMEEKASSDGKKTSWTRIFEHERIHNELMATKSDFRSALFALIMIDSRTIWTMTSLLAYIGYHCLGLIYFALVTVGFGILLFDHYLGGFSGRGLAGAMKAAVPIMVGVGAATLCQSLILFLEEVGMASTFFGVAARVLVMEGEEWRACNSSNSSLCTTALNVSEYCEFTNPACSEGMKTRASLLRLLQIIHPPSGDFSWTILIGEVWILLLVLILTSISFKHVVNKGKYVVFPAFCIKYLLFLICGWIVRRKGSPVLGILAFAHFGERYQRHDVSTGPESWLLCGHYFFQFFSVGQGVLGGLSRRSQLGGSIVSEIYLLISTSFWIHVVAGFTYLWAVPGSEFVHEKVFGRNSEGVFGHFPMFWTLLALETVETTKIGKFGTFLLLLCQTITSLAKLVIVMDIVRTGCMEMISSKKKLRMLYGPVVVVAALILGIMRCIQPLGHELVMWILHRLGALLVRGLLVGWVSIAFIAWYGINQIHKDIALFIRSALLKNFRPFVILSLVVGPLFIFGVGLADFMNFKEAWKKDLLEYKKTHGLSHALTVIGGICGLVVPFWGFHKILREKSMEKLVKCDKEEWGPQDRRFWTGDYRGFQPRFRREKRLKPRKAAKRKPGVPPQTIPRTKSQVRLGTLVEETFNSRSSTNK